MGFSGDGDVEEDPQSNDSYRDRNSPTSHWDVERKSYDDSIDDRQSNDTKSDCSVMWSKYTKRDRRFHPLY